MSQRPLFDPKKMAAGKAQPAPVVPPTSPVLSVSALAGVIDTALKLGVPTALRVIGEVSGFRDRTHWYFDLKDANAVVNAVMFQAAARRAGFTPTNGQEVVASGRVEFYAKQGKASLLIEKLEPVGAGALELAYRQLCDELRALGWFEQARKRPLPTFPRKIALVTSRSAAAFQDVLVTMKRRCPGVGVLLADVRVQGDGAAQEVADTVRFISAHHQRLGVDAVLVTRGGGSMEDLWAFNERIVAQAIVECAVPVVAAIGHETDVTIAELVADERCATPTQAAMRLTPDSDALIHQLDSLDQRLRFVTTRQLRGERERVERAAARPVFGDPRALLRQPQLDTEHAVRRLNSSIQLRWRSLSIRIERLTSRLERCQPRTLQARTLTRLHALDARLASSMKSRLKAIDVDARSIRLCRATAVRLHAAAASADSTEKQLRAVGPLRVLERGFSVTTRADGRIVRAPSDVRGGDHLTTRVADGTIDSKVEGESPATRAVPRSTTARRGDRSQDGKRSADTDAQLGLF